MMKEEDFYKIDNSESIQINIELLIEDIEIRKKFAAGKLNNFEFKKLLDY